MERAAQKDHGVQVEAHASQARQLGRRLILKFRGEARPELQRIEFKFKGSCLSSYQQRGDTDFPLKWRKLPDALSLFFLDYIAWGFRNPSEPFFFEDKSNAGLATTLDDAVYQPTHGLRDIFSEVMPDKSRLPTVIHSIWIRDKQPDGSMRLAANRNFLPPDCIEIFWDGQGTEALVNPENANTVAHLIRESLGLARPNETKENDRKAPAWVSRENLPPPPAFFLDNHLKALRAQLLSKMGQNGLTVLRDIGGMGKTTLAKKILHEAIGEGLLPGGAAWINCESKPTLDECNRIVTENLSRSERGTNSVTPKVEGNQAIVVFDNFESVRDDDQINRRVKELAEKAHVLITTKEGHPGLEPSISFPPFERADAISLFIHESKIDEPTEDQRQIIGRLCEFVSRVPLAIVLLAGRCPMVSLRDIELELHANLREVLQSDDHFVEPRQRSMKAAVLTSFTGMKAEDRDTLFSLLVVPNGIGKTLVRSYLAKRNWLSSLGNCVNAGLLRVENDRYRFHPLVRLFLLEELGEQKSEWDCRFTDFFCKELEALTHTPFVDWKTLPVMGEAQNCREALKIAGQSMRLDQFLLAFELLPDELHYEIDHEASLAKLLGAARRQHDKTLEERVLALQFGCEPVYSEGPDNKRQIVLLEHLSALNPSRAEGLKEDFEAYHHVERGMLPQAEKALRISVEAWNKAGRLFHANEDASLLNLFLVVAQKKKRKEAGRLGQRLWERWQKGCYCYLTSKENGVEWAEAYKHFDEALESWQNSHFECEIAIKVSESLLDLGLCRDAEPWLRRGLQLARVSPVHKLCGGWRDILLDLGGVCRRLGQEKDADTAYREILSSKTVDHISESAAFEIAKIAAGRSDYDQAIEAGQLAVQFWRTRAEKRARWDESCLTCEDEPLTYPISRARLKQMLALISSWEKSVKSHKTRSRNRS